MKLETSRRLLKQQRFLVQHVAVSNSSVMLFAAGDQLHVAMGTTFSCKVIAKVSQ